MRVLLTGAAGFIGSHVTERLLADGASVAGLARQCGAQSALRISS